MNNVLFCTGDPENTRNAILVFCCDRQCKLGFLFVALVEGHGQVSEQLKQTIGAITEVRCADAQPTATLQIDFALPLSWVAALVCMFANRRGGLHN